MTPSTPDSTAPTVAAATSASTTMSFPADGVQLAPNYRLPLALIVAALPLFLVQPWLSSAIALFGLFLFYQTLTLRLWFMPAALDIYRGDTLIRRFPYQDWQNWQIFWQPVPILFYFKEVKSIHFLPILFDPQALRSCLQQQFPPKN
jgi:hypothetical protein